MPNDPQPEESLFNAARELADPARRRAFLDQACGADLALRARVERLLKAAETADDFLASCAPAMEAAAGLQPSEESSSQDFRHSTDERVGSRIGPYKLLQKIGEGGYGVVYMAEQERPVRRRVALKVIKLGMDTKAVIARFEAERQALAMMDHPNIARALDAGATEEGRPYFVMELVYGSKITDYCDQNQLPVTERLKVFIQVCHGLQHAHQKGIIHRDIKPSNILVTMHDGVPVPKVIDFGIAKATQQSLTDKTLFTSYTQLIGTPAYMSPEQMELSGLNLDTRSDIYCLGVLLYELLTGRTPFDTAELLKAGVDEMRRTLQQREPSSPSAKLRTLSGEELTKTALLRQADPRRFPSHLRGDLDRIVMKCLDKNRNRRYETANGLAMDIERHLNNEPVLARSPSRWYRFQKLAQRNRIVFLSGAAVAAALLLGTIVSTRLFFKERAARSAAERLGRDAEMRENESHIALLVTQRRFDEANKLLADVPLEKPSIEVAAELRALGDWHAANGRWPQAAERFSSLVKIDQLDDRDLTSLDQLKLAVALLAAGDRDGYEQLRQKIIAKFTPTAAPTAHSIIKACLLLPAKPTLVQSLVAGPEEIAKVSPRGDDAQATPRHGVQWSDAMAFLEYRRANFADTIHQKYLVDNPPGFSTVSFIKAMACWRLRDYWGATVDWIEGYELMLARSKQKHAALGATSEAFPGMAEPDSLEGAWYDWVIADLLMREWDGMLSEVEQSVDSMQRRAQSPENAALFRALGEWHAIRREWGQARQRFDSCLRCDQKDTWDHATMDYYDDSITCLELGNESAYLRLREEAAERFKDMDNTSNAERILKISLLRPTAGNAIATLRPFADVLAGKLRNLGESEKQTDPYIAWYSMLLGLFEYRRGNYAGAMDWAHQSLETATGIVALPNATDRVILAMSLYQLGNQTAARLELEQAKTLLQNGFDLEFDMWHWRDWVFVRILLEEASLLMPEESSPTSTTAPQ